MFVGCSFQTSIYETFKSHKSRQHTPHTLADFLPGIVKTTTIASPPLDDLFSDSQGEECVVQEVSDSSQEQHSMLPSAIEQHLGAALLKLEYLVHVPGTVIDYFFTRTLPLVNHSISHTI